MRKKVSFIENCINGIVIPEPVVLTNNNKCDITLKFQCTFNTLIHLHMILGKLLCTIKVLYI